MADCPTCNTIKIGLDIASLVPPFQISSLAVQIRALTAIDYY